MDGTANSKTHTLLLDTESDIEKTTTARNRRHSNLLRQLLLAISLCLNALLLVSLAHVQFKLNGQRISYSGLPYNTPTTYQTDSPWSSTNESLADPLWESLDSSPIVIALSDAEAQSRGLELSARFPWDDSKGIYHIKAFHHTHCLRNLRKAYIDLYHGRQQVVAYSHFMHCLDSIRQDIMCIADDTLMPTKNEKHKIGDGQVQQCRDWNKLISWAQAPERHSCFHMLDEYRTVHKTLEQFDACPSNSPYASAAAEYFSQWGHQNPFT